MTYDGFGRKVFESEWTVAGFANPPGTTFDYTLDGTTFEDPFGRVQKATTADGQVTTFAYRALEKEVSVVGINNDPLQSATTRFVNDELGNLVFVDSPNPGSDAT